MPPISEPTIAAICIVAIISSIDLKEVRQSNPAIPETIENKPPVTIPRAKPKSDRATIPPAIPPTAMTTATLQFAQTPSEHKTAINNVTSYSDRKLNWYQRSSGSGVLMVSVV